MTTHIKELPNSITITRPDDWHLHLRDGAKLFSVLLDTVRRFERALIMPNLKPPITTTEMARTYHATIRHLLVQAIRQGLLPPDTTFEPLMTLYLTDRTTAREIRAAKRSGIVYAVKYYPAGATTNSDSGVTHISKVGAALEEMEKCGMVLCMHGEVNDLLVDIFDREKAFIDEVLRQLVRDFPALKIVFEHVTTKQGVQFVESAGPNIAATVTAHHLLYNRNALFQGGVRPHHYCLPVLKREEHRFALLMAATKDSPKFFGGTDSAPHSRYLKENACGCAGCYTAHAALELYAEAFEQADALGTLEAFVSFRGADFYGVPRNTGTITLHRNAWTVPAELPFGDDMLVPLRAGETIHWKLAA